MWIDDQILKNFDRRFYIESFVPQSTVVVLGSGNDPNLEVSLTQCDLRSIPILRRYGGGGTVVLYPGCVVVSIGCWVREQFQNSLYFQALNQSVIDALAKSWRKFQSLGQAGISDIVIDGRKVAGTSMFRSRNYLLYQASILVELDRDLVGSVLLHPSKEPDYRKGRSHKDFLTSLAEVEPTISSAAQVSKALVDHLDGCFKQRMGEHLIDPVPAQMSALIARLERASETPAI